MSRENARRVYDFPRVVPLAAILERYQLLCQLKRLGNQLFGSCPLHQGTNKKQFVVDLNKGSGVWRCFGDCDRGGGTLEFVAAMERVEIKQAGKLVREWFALGPRSQVEQHRKPQRSKAMSEGSKQPTHRVYSSSKRGEGEKDWLTQIGSAWVFNTKDGREGLSILLTAMPLGERMVIFARDEEYEKKKEADKQATPNGKLFGKKK